MRAFASINACQSTNQMPPVKTRLRRAQCKLIDLRSVQIRIQCKTRVVGVGYILMEYMDVQIYNE